MNTPGCHLDFAEALANDPGLKELHDLYCQPLGPAPRQVDPAHRRVRPLNYDHRPASYWTVGNHRQLVTHTHGAERKKSAVSQIAAGRLDGAREAILQDSPGAAGQKHPALTGGEILPGDLPGEVEIAHIMLTTVTRDVISLRARPDAGLIRYRVVDDYGSRTPVKPEVSTEPLTLGEVIRLIDSAHSETLGPIGVGVLDQNWQSGCVLGEQLAGFLKASSEFYPDLEEHFWWQVQRWVTRHRGRRHS